MTMIHLFRQPVHIFLRGTCLISLILSLAGCATVDRPSKSPAFPHAYTERHPIVLRNAPFTLDVYVTGHQLDRRQVTDLKNYAEEYVKYGKGYMVVSVPTGTEEDALIQRGLKGIRLVLQKNKVPASRLKISSYGATNAVGAPPIKLSYTKFVAEVDSKCGLYPDDLSGLQGGVTFQNRDYWNFGCAYQTHLANQVDDPRDFIAGRAETPPDTENRMMIYQKYRKGGMEELADD